MKKVSYWLIVWLSAMVGAGLVACGDPAGNPNHEGETTEEMDSFDRVMLLEQFTSERCVNCPNGVMQIDDYLSAHQNVVWLCHHAGYGDDQWTISDSKAITKLLNVTGAPSIALDRNYLNAVDPVQGDKSGYNLHPYYLNLLTETPSTTTTASIRIKNTYEDGKLHIRVAGKLKEEAPEHMLLTVAIKESGLHGAQADGNFTLAGMWDDYVHANVIRRFVSAVGGDAIVRDSDTYEMHYDIEWDSQWLAENCMVVAFLTDENSLHVVQAAEKPVVEGSHGGADLAHGGVTPKAVPEGYPEGKYAMSDFIKADTVRFQFARAGYNRLSNGLLEWHLMAWTTAQSYGSGQNLYIPFTDVIFFTEGSVTSVPTAGEYPFVIARSLDDIRTSTAWAGNCDLEAQAITGSELLLVSKAVFEVGNIQPGSNGRWLIADGKLSFSEKGFAVDATSATGKVIQLVFEGTYIK